MTHGYFYNGNLLTLIKQIGREPESNLYLLADETEQYVCKQIIAKANESVESVTNRFNTEIVNYEKLRESKVNVPKLLEANAEHHYLIKEYVPGERVSDLVSRGAVTTQIFLKAFEFSEDLKRKLINLDYFPSNFIVARDEIYYIDYEINEYIDEWDFTHWGIYYWLNQEGMKLYNDTNRLDLLQSSSLDTKPRTLGYENTVAELKALYQHQYNKKIKS